MFDHRTERARVGDSGAAGGRAEGNRLPLGLALGLLGNQDRVGIPISPHALDAENQREKHAGSERQADLKMRIQT